MYMGLSTSVHGASCLWALCICAWCKNPSLNWFLATGKWPYWLGEQSRVSGLVKADLGIQRLCGINSFCAQQPYLATLDSLMNEWMINRWYSRWRQFPSALVELFVPSIFSHETYFFPVELYWIFQNSLLSLLCSSITDGPVSRARNSPRGFGSVPQGLHLCYRTNLQLDWPLGSFLNEPMKGRLYFCFLHNTQVEMRIWMGSESLPKFHYKNLKYLVFKTQWVIKQ